MIGPVRTLAVLALALLLAALLLGVLAGIAFMLPVASPWLDFTRLRPLHTTTALFWILTGAVAVMLASRTDAVGVEPHRRLLNGFLFLWAGSLAIALISYLVGKFGGREYWEFPPWLALPIGLAWVLLLIDHARALRGRGRGAPMYLWMWTTGLIFFLFTFVEQNLWLLPAIRSSYLRDLTVQWKSNGSMVGAWNQLIYGASLYLAVRVSGNETLARSGKAHTFWFLGLANLMFNWGHHLYNAPTAGWLRHAAYAISMAEWLIMFDILRGMRTKPSTTPKEGFGQRCLRWAEHWVLLNLLLALLMSVPALNRFTHGTHVTVAHAMGATIGINTFILLACIAHWSGFDAAHVGRWPRAGLRIAGVALHIMWSALILAGVLKGWRAVGLGLSEHAEVMRPVMPVLVVSVASGAVVAVGLALVVIPLIRQLLVEQNASTRSRVSA
ncbi:MAG: cbb3-type cytochrome c oxidase subunit I [Flavobacteriales bacterium]|nr:cbb3-type cytochrome c oxidase subunit I [Flavobacteriales bacterium]MBK7941629.1 cbb3-type cytochrome c oxidase subunit I [Flavobacteriales bacterium]MBK9700172.1 cbb3-type cytochrome c oxidase subunit I [Flavobacteriales bacterium]